MRRTRWFGRGSMRARIGVAVILLCAGIAAPVYAQELTWAKGVGGTDTDEGVGIAVDGAGNSTVTGYFFGTATFGAGEPNETILTSAGGASDFDLFVAKYDSSGSLLWARRDGGTNSDQPYAIAVDAPGNSIVTGLFRGATTFGAGEPNETTLTSTGGADFFVAKYDPSGSLLWARRAGGTNEDAGFGIAVDADGNSIVTGLFRDTATFGAGEPNETTLISVGLNEVFVAKYDPSGSMLWARRDGGVSSDLSLGIAVDAAGNSFVTGYFSGTTTFGAGKPNETTLTSAGVLDTFVAKYDPNGLLLWARRDGGISSDLSLGIAVDTAGNSFVTGQFEGTAIFGAGEPNETTLTSAGALDTFVAKYDPSGSLLWARRDGGISGQGGFGISVDSAGRSAVTGYFSGTTTFGSGEPNETTLISAGVLDIFVAKYDPSGSLLWARQDGGTGLDEGYGIAMDAAGNSYVIGRFEVTATFGAGEPNETTLTSAGYEDIFVAKIMGAVPGELTITDLRIKDVDSSDRLRMSADFALGAGSDGIDPAAEGLTVRLSTPAGEFYSRAASASEFSVRGDAPTRQWALNDAGRSRLGIEKLEIAEEGGILLVDRNTSVPTRSYATVDVEVIIVDDVLGGQSLLEEGKAGSGSWRLIR